MGEPPGEGHPGGSSDAKAMSRVRPTRPLSPLAAAVMILGLWWLVAHNGGSGWVQVLGDIVFGVLAIGILGPAVVLARAKVTVASCPADGVAALPVELRVTASTRLRMRAAIPPGEEVFVGPGQPLGGPVVLRPERRGVFETVTLDIASAAPFGLQWWTRRVRLVLPSTLHVAPRRGRPAPIAERPYDENGDVVDRAHRDLGQARGARPYRWGDNRRLAHWRSTAHVGELMVRELERPSAEPITITVHLPHDPEEAERVAEHALGTAVLVLERGAPVVLATTEATGAVLAPVSDRRTAGRRLARAVARSGAAVPLQTVAVSL
jgi:uncharacterized protein (DUF58 family)